MNNVHRFVPEMQPARPYPPFDPREQAVMIPDDPPSSASVIRAQAATILELQDALHELARAPKADDQMALLDTQAAVERLAERLGSYRRLAQWVRNIGAIHGEEV